MAKEVLHQVILLDILIISKEGIVFSSEVKKVEMQRSAKKIQRMVKIEQGEEGGALGTITRSSICTA